MKPRPKAGFVLFTTGMFWLTMAIASAALWPIYLSTHLVLLVAATVFAGSVIAILGALFRWPSFVLLLATFLVFLLIGVPLAVPDQALYGVVPTLPGLQELLAGVALGWKQLLTISLPVGSYEALLVPPFVLILVATVAGLSVALRSRYGEFAALAPVAVFVMAIAFGPDYALWPIELALGLLAAILLWLMYFRWYRRRAAIRLLLAQARTAGGVRRTRSSEARFVGVRTLVGAAVIIAIASSAAVAAAFVLPPDTDRTVLRTTFVQPFDPRDYVSPLAGFRGYWQPASVNSLLFTVDGLPDGGRIRIATMDTYNGIVYSVGSAEATSESGSFTRVPYRFDQSDTRGTAVSITVLVGGYRGVWMPTVGQFESVEFGGERASALRDAFYYNDTSGTAAVLGGLDAGDSYTLTGVVPQQPASAELAALDPGSASVPAAGPMPDELAAALDEYVTGVDGQGARLVAMLDGIKREGYISHGVAEDEPPSRSGHAADRITELFTGAPMIGDAEQYAVAAALMARELGFPARVVFGFVPDTGQVRGVDASAWIEVNSAQFGWVTIDPNPEVRPIPEELPEEPTQIARPQTIVPPPIVESESFDRQLTPESQEDIPNDVDPWLALLIVILTAAGWVALALAILLSPFMVVIAAKLRRRRLRRRAAAIVDRISGGWQEFEDTVIDYGIATPPAATRSEVATTVGLQQSHLLAAVADRAVFSPDQPNPEEAVNVWHAVDELKKSLGSDATRWQRIKARVSVRSLGGYSVPRLFKR